MTNDAVDMSEAKELVAAFTRAAGLRTTKQKTKWWFYAEGRHVILDKGQPVQRGARFLGSFRTVNKDIFGRMLLACLWPDEQGVVFKWPAWKCARRAELENWLGVESARDLVEDIARAAVKGDVHSIAEGVTRYGAIMQERREYLALGEWIHGTVIPKLLEQKAGADSPTEAGAL